jgi:hypothetical protein
VQSEAINCCISATVSVTFEHTGRLTHVVDWVCLVSDCHWLLSLSISVSALGGFALWGTLRGDAEIQRLIEP